MITLYHSPQSRSSRMIWLLEELGHPYEIRQVRIFRPVTGEGGPDAENPHPDKRVPAIVHDGQLVAESVAIVLYLNDAFPQTRLGPAAGDAARGEYLTWIAWYAAELERVMFYGLGGELEQPMKKRSRDVVLERLHAVLDQAPYVMGERFTGADLLIASAIHYGRRAFPESAVLDAYVARCRTRPAALRALELDNANGVQGKAMAAA